MNNNHAIFVNTIFTNDFSALGGAIYNSGYLELNYCNFNNNSEVTGLSHKNNDVFNYAPENALNIDHCGNITVKQEKKPSVVKQALMNGVGVGLFVTSTVAISTILAPASGGLSFIGYVGCGALSGFVFGAGCAGYSYMSSHDSHYDLWSEQTLEIVLSNTLAGASGATVGYGLGKIGTILKNINELLKSNDKIISSKLEYESSKKKSAFKPLSIINDIMSTSTIETPSGPITYFDNHIKMDLSDSIQIYILKKLIKDKSITFTSLASKIPNFYKNVKNIGTLKGLDIYEIVGKNYRLTFSTQNEYVVGLSWTNDLHSESPFKKAIIKNSNTPTIKETPPIKENNDLITYNPMRDFFDW